ncbi:hypothetical protein I4U23_001405 [Adineta vaga]|nr:hypothetical protein I4U23_001405 [Adineta vaga]
MFLDENYLVYIFKTNWTFSKLRNLHIQGTRWTMGIRFENGFCRNILVTSLNVLRRGNLPTKSIFKVPLSNNNQIDESDSNDILCPYINYLSTDQCSETRLLRILQCTPMLTHLKLCGNRWDQSSLYYGVLWDNIQLNLIELIIEDMETYSLDLLARMLNTSNVSLRKCRVHICNYDRIDGDTIKRMFQPCEQLKHFEFFFEYHSSIHDLDPSIESIKNEWQFDSHHLSIYIQKNEVNRSIKITSMPCHSSFIFINNLYDWCVNEMDSHSNHFRFTNVNQIHITNNVDQLITLGYLYFLDRTFTAAYQTLQFDVCILESPEILFDMLIEDTSMPPVLRRVHKFIINSLDNFTPFMLCVWILLMPNLEILKISNLRDFDKIILVKELFLEINRDERLKSKFEHIKEVVLFEKDDYITPEMSDVAVKFQNIFINAIIH